MLTRSAARRSLQTVRIRAGCANFCSMGPRPVFPATGRGPMLHLVATKGRAKSFVSLRCSPSRFPPNQEFRIWGLAARPQPHDDCVIEAISQVSQRLIRHANPNETPCSGRQPMTERLCSSHAARANTETLRTCRLPPAPGRLGQPLLHQVRLERSGTNRRVAETHSGPLAGVRVRRKVVGRSVTRRRR